MKDRATSWLWRRARAGKMERVSGSVEVWVVVMTFILRRGAVME